jgi:hypothetical protein
VTWAIDERDVSHQKQFCFAVFALGLVLLRRPIGLEAFRSWTFRALVELGVGVTKLNGDVSDFLFLMPYSLLNQNDKKTRDTYVDSGDGSHQGGFTVGHMADSTDVLGSLSRNDFWGKWCDFVHIKVLKRLLGQMGLLCQGLDLGLNDFFAIFFEL